MRRAPSAPAPRPTETPETFALPGAFGFGIPSIALTGGYCVAEGLAFPGGATTAGLTAAALLVGAAAIVQHGATLASRWRNAVTAALRLILAVLGGSTLPRWGREFHWPEAAALLAIWQGMALAFISHTGWELFAALSEEMRKPRRDFPLAVVISFVTVSLLYLGAALAVQSTVTVEDPRLIRVPCLPRSGYWPLLARSAGSCSTRWRSSPSLTPRARARSSSSAARDDRPLLRSLSLSHTGCRWDSESAAGIEAGGRDPAGGSVHESLVRGPCPRSRPPLRQLCARSRRARLFVPFLEAIVALPAKWQSTLNRTTVRGLLREPP
ncbi:amino acid permease [Azospirillum doebereinerae]